MNVTVEISLAPFADDYKTPILSLIQKLKSSGLTVNENALSTDITGEYSKVMGILTTEVKDILEAIDRGMVFIKIKK